MAQVTSGIRSLLSHAWIYNLWGVFLGAEKARTDFIVNYLKANRGDKIFDIGCGTGKLLEWMPEGVDYTGFDLSESYIEAAKEKYGDRGTFIHAGVGEAPEISPDSQDIAIATGVLHHLSDEESLGLFELAKSSLKEGGRLITSDPVYDDGQSSIARFLISRDRGQNVREKEGYLEIARQVFDTVEYEVRHDRLRIPYSHMMITCTK